MLQVNTGRRCVRGCSVFIVPGIGAGKFLRLGVKRTGQASIILRMALCCQCGFCAFHTLFTCVTTLLHFRFRHRFDFFDFLLDFGRVEFDFDGHHTCIETQSLILH
ncbi:hypothetical protein BC830DRAFT_1110998 [Chytriomyces sp. MP71]|nr:hypothetical protein BC830DRAFT_1110998 [Chytriomyces sp. MP71]